MRQSQKSNRTRGRGRKATNPLSRSYDSNGPDVKIRGTASHIAEKYQSLARDAISSGDLVMAENYYQHAEHYLRIIAASQPAPQPAPRDEGRPNNSDGPNNANRKPANVNSDNGDEASNNNGAEVEDTASEMDVVAIAEVPGSGEQPVIEPPAEVVDEEVAAAAAPRRRRRTTYRSRKRPTAAERKAEGGEGGDAAAPKEKPAAVAAED